ncbi:NAD(P)/FAD-dependent oxidoreductase [Virgibacillus senegalensis]|uniref:NAD(P)/FAD-dependent oxidoreductase n=1 Tax=Virgibacillus senegalensis TaxID=1499679 RepID=UPI00069D2F9C|nr:FAD-dependent monooxygenase [Virgibacillus senegalensis]
MYDIIIVGARCAGASLCIRLAELGYRILILDKSHFPSDTNSTHIFGEIYFFERYNIKERLTAVPSPDIKRMRVDLEGSVFEADIMMTDRVTTMRRIELDQMLVQRMEQYDNVTFVKEASFVKAIKNSEVSHRVSYIKSNKEFFEEGKVIIGADGKYSKFAKNFAAPIEHKTESQPPAFYGYFSSVKPLTPPCVEWYVADSHICICTPTNNHLHTVLITPLIDQNDWAKQPREKFMSTLPKFSNLYSRFSSMDEEVVIKGIGKREMYIKKAFGDHWAIVGDALGWVHPISGSGMDDAFLGSELLAQSLHHYFQGLDEWQNVMENYETEIKKHLLSQINRVLTTFETFKHPIPHKQLEYVNLFCTYPSLIHRFGSHSSETIRELDERFYHLFSTILQT